MIIIDSSVWIDHLRRPVPGVLEALTSERAIQHPFVTAELALGSLAQRDRFLRALQALPATGVVSETEWYDFVEGQHLHGSGLGFVDVHLLVTAAAFGHQLWTRDKRLAHHAAKLGCAFAGN